MEQKTKKRKWLKIGGIVGGVIVIAVIILVLSLDSIIERGVRYFGTQATGTPVGIQSFSSMLLTGRFALEQLSVGNPEGCLEPDAIKLHSLIVQVQPASLLSDTIVIDEIAVDGLVIDLEPRLNGVSNLSLLLDHISAYAGGGESAPAATTAETPAATTAAAPETPGKKVMIRLVKVTNAKIIVANKLVNGKITIPLPDFTMTDIGEQSSSGAALLAFFERLLAAVGQAIANSGITAIDVKGIGAGLIHAGDSLLNQTGAGLSEVGGQLLNQTGDSVSKGLDAVKNLF